MRFYFWLFVCLLLIRGAGFGQVVTTDPLFPKADQPVKIIVDVSGTSLDNYPWDNNTSPVWIWAWIDQGCASNCDAPTNINPATGGQDAAKATRISTNPDRYEITFTPTVFFNKPASELKRIGIKLKSRDWNDNKQTDNNRYINLYEGFALALSSPSTPSVFVNSGERIPISAGTSEPASFIVRVDGSLVHETSNSTTLEYEHVVSQSAGSYDVEITATNGSEVQVVKFHYVIRTAAQNQIRPDGIIDGINYHDDATKVTLCLLAPGKSNIYLIGDFSDWRVLAQNQMKKDGERFWLTLSNITPGQEYAYQYLLDESIRVADPFADKIVDPDDQYISEQIYPSLKTFPNEARTDRAFLDRLAVFQTGQTPYNWTTTQFEKPPVQKLVIYELLVRDFFAADHRSYQSLIDTISYFKRLGVNAIELMPIMEFNGNDSWGYNPTFMFAPDKAFGPKEKLKEFIDKCHQEGIAVILDIAMNHQDIQNPYILMDFDFSSNSLPVSNKWFNPSAKHPYNVFFDMNHESAYTKAYLDTVNHYWLNEYKVDGYRFDLSKGFTQNERCNGSTSDEQCFGQKSEARIALLKRMADKIREHSPDAILILEHFAEDSEEVELSNYGFLLWGNANHAYSQNTMGLSANSDISRGYYKSRGFTQPHLITYMESHDEERLMYRNKNFGSSLGTYNVRETSTALERMRAAGALFYTIPGPKMLWQFGEFGYDQSINRCVNGSINNECRLAAKPVLWNYLDQAEHLRLFDHTADLLRIREMYNVFTSGDASFNGFNSVVKQVTIKNNPYTTVPQNASQMNVHIVANFDVIQRTIDVTFPHNGVWFEYNREGESIEVNSPVTKMALPPGRYKLFTDVPIPSGFQEDEYELITSAEIVKTSDKKVYPNPVTNELYVSDDLRIDSISFFDMKGRNIAVSSNSPGVFDFSDVPLGMYILRIDYPHESIILRIIKN